MFSSILVFFQLCCWIIFSRQSRRNHPWRPMAHLLSPGLAFSRHIVEKNHNLRVAPRSAVKHFSKLIFFTLGRWTVFFFLNFISWFGSSPVFTDLHQALHLIPPVWASKIIELLFTFQCSRSIFLSFQKFIWNFFQCSWSSFFTRRCFKEGAWQTIGDREVRFWLFCCIFKRTWYEIDLMFDTNLTFLV